MRSTAMATNSQETGKLTLPLDGLLSPPLAVSKVASQRVVTKLAHYPQLPFEFGAEFINHKNTKRRPATRKQAGFEDTHSEGTEEPISSSSPALLAEMTPWPADATTVMLRNIPNRYSSGQVLEELVDRGLEGAFDFFYLPYDFKKKHNRGYAFINLLSVSLANSFRVLFHGQKFTKYTTQKVLEISVATTQGFDANAQKFLKRKSGRTSNPWFRPMIFTPGASTGDSRRCLPLSAENLLSCVKGHSVSDNEYKPVRPPPGLQQLQPAVRLSQALGQQESDLAKSTIGCEMEIAAAIQAATKHFLHCCISSSVRDVEKQKGRASSQF
eukprot:TRINITY_DN5460_c0_g1_i3.p1 TRINITY_DN5460_c0_g1~~TRINITY_DN5460_c0_g1_i3.p1  ORF type:complete len:327 (-),score=59.82 TRINITY_DN5460_c0_g1_i3:193-1173(-)